MLTHGAKATANAVRRLWAGRTRPLLSFVLIAYNMQRELPRTLESLSRDYQRGSQDIDYEVIVVDNGSNEPLDLSGLQDLGVPVRLFRRDNAGVSPADAINFGAAQSAGDYLAIMIDGARLLSPGVVRGAREALALAAQPVVAVLGLHLGPGHQRQTIEQGYSKEVEDQLLATVNWPQNGYGLFQIAAWGGSCPGGWLTKASESNCIILSRNLFQRLGGYDEAFKMPGGGLVNLDFYKRAVEHRDSTLIYLGGEGCFHQYHGGVTTGQRSHGHSFADLDREYRTLRGEGFTRPRGQPRVYGQLWPECAPALFDACKRVMEQNNLDKVDDRCRAVMAAHGTEHMANDAPD